MEVSDRQLLADRDRMFADWGEPIVLRRVEQSFDPETHQISETVTDTSVAAIVGESPSHASPGTGGHAREIDLTVQIKAEDFPSVTGDAALRVVHVEIEYEAIAQVQSAQRDVWELGCRRIG